MSRANSERPVCAIGDVHGRADLLGAMLDHIERELPDARVVLLGDLIDRGPDAKGALELAMTLGDRFDDTLVLLGNHENWLLSALSGDTIAWENWRRWGGRATLRSFGIDPDLQPEQMHEAFEERAGPVLRFLWARPRSWFGDGAAQEYFFAHAGVDPYRPLDDQDDEDLIWIREPFLSHSGTLERTVVHGHTISSLPTVAPHRIGIDTGAYDSDLLSALVIEQGGTTQFLAATGDAWETPKIGPGTYHFERGWSHLHR